VPDEEETSARCCAMTRAGARVTRLAAVLLSLGFCGCAPTPKFQLIPVPAGAPSFITRGELGDFWFAESGGLGHLRADGSIEELSLPSGTPNGLAVGPDHGVWYAVGTDAGVAGAQLPGNEIGRFDPATVNVTKFPIPTSSSNPVGVTFDVNGALWFTEEAAGKVGRLSQAGAMTEFAAQVGHPQGISAAEDGSVWYAELNGVGRISNEQVSTFATNEVDGFDVSAGRNGSAWFTKTVDYKLGVIAPPGTERLVDLPYSTNAVRLAALSDGTVWYIAAKQAPEVPAGATGAIGKIDAAGHVEQFDIPGGGVPFGLAVSADGSVAWFTEETNGVLGRFWFE
jgi:virginiamycin B lyase